MLTLCVKFKLSSSSRVCKSNSDLGSNGHGEPAAPALWFLYICSAVAQLVSPHTLSPVSESTRRVPGQRGGGARGARAAEGLATALRPVGRCQRCRGRPEKPTRWQVQPHPGLRPPVFFFFCLCFSLERFFYFLKDKYPYHSLPPHRLVTFVLTSHALSAVTSVDPLVLSLHPQTFCFDPFFY